MMVVDITTQPTFTAGTPRVLFRREFVPGTPRQGYDVSPDGQRFLMPQAVEQETAATQLIVVQNWFEELKRRAPSSGK
jgi:hypothetical protein